MSLKIGEWQMNENGTPKNLTISGVDPANGVVSGSIEAIGDLSGLWDETSRTISFTCGQRFYKGCLFGTPSNPAPGQDMVWTLAGFVQINKLDDAASMGGNASRNVFGWFAQITEVETPEVALSDFNFLLTAGLLTLTFILTASAATDFPVTLTIAPINPGFPESVTIPAGVMMFQHQMAAPAGGGATFTVTAVGGGVSRTIAIFLP
jgi:hypothetical protein